MNEHFIIASCKPWHYRKFEVVKARAPNNWTYVGTPVELEQAVQKLEPRYIFFLHWNWHVPNIIWRHHDCICFHMSDVPYGRGGSPLQNLIQLGHLDTQLSALRMVEEMDAGPVYTKRPLSLEGRAEEIYLRAGDISWELIDWIVRTQPEPTIQTGKVFTFNRRGPAQSALPTVGGVHKIYDHIRMLDAPTYPLAFLEHGNFVLEFSHAEKCDDEVRARVVIREKNGEQTE